MTNGANQDQQHKQSTDSMQDLPIVSNLNPATNIPATPSSKQQTQDDADDAVQALLQARDEGPNQC